MRISDPPGKQAGARPDVGDDVPGLQSECADDLIGLETLDPVRVLEGLDVLLGRAPGAATGTTCSEFETSCGAAPETLRRFDPLVALVPAHLAPCLQRQVPDVRRARRLVRDADVGRRLFAAPDAVEPVLQMRPRPVARGPGQDLRLGRAGAGDV